MQQLAYKAYGEVTSRTANNGQIEYALFDEITQALKSVDQDEMPSPAVLGDVIVRNRSMHTATNYYLFSLALSDLVILLLGELDWSCRGQTCLALLLRIWMG